MTADTLLALARKLAEDAHYNHLSPAEFMGVVDRLAERIDALADEVEEQFRRRRHLRVVRDEQPAE